MWNNDFEGRLQTKGSQTNQIQYINMRNLNYTLLTFLSTGDKAGCTSQLYVNKETNIPKGKVRSDIT